MKRNIVLVFAIIAIIGTLYYLESLESPRLSLDTVEIAKDMDKNKKAKKYEPAKELAAIEGYINSEEFKLADYIGKKVILLDIWTFSCINCQRTLPYITGWWDKYKDSGLLIVGVHTPEFDFEKDIENVKSAVERFGVEYPVVLDNKFATWNAYNNRYWPRKYLIDIDGYIVYDHIGEGGYDETEKKIQELLAERNQVLGTSDEIAGGILEPENVEDVDLFKEKSPEIYFGASRNTFLGNGESGSVGVQIFEEPKGIKTNILYLSGEWDIRNEFAENKSENAKIIFQYEAEKVFMVLSSQDGVNLTILRDGEPIGEAAGSSVKDGVIHVQKDQLYRIVEDPEGHGVHTLEIIVDKPGLKAFTFTFG